MDPILSAVNYIFKKNGKNNANETFKSFFEDGISFPQFVALAFNIESIPKCIPNPKTVIDKNMNNLVAYQYLISNNIEIAQLSSQYSNEKEQINLLSLILTKQCFNLNIDYILEKINKIFQPTQTFNSKNEIMNEKFILELLNYLTDRKIKLDENLPNNDQILIKYFNEENVPLIINKSSNEIQNQYLYLIQIEIILDIFIEKINKKEFINIENNDLKKNYSVQNKSESHNEENQLLYFHELAPIDESTTTDKMLQISNTKEHLTSSNDNYSNDEFMEEFSTKKENDNIEIKYSNNINKNTSSSEDSDESIYDHHYTKCDDENEQLKSNVLLNAINAIGKNINLHFINIEQTIENNNLPKFVYYILKDDQDSCNIIKGIIKNVEYSNFDKIKATVQHLKDKYFLFEILVLDFKDPQYIKTSIETFYSNLLHLFLKRSKSELFERLHSILYINNTSFFDDIESDEEYKVLKNINTYYALLHFVYKGKVLKINDSNGRNIINPEWMPLLFNEDYLTNFVTNYDIPIPIYCQLQLIFDYFDKKAKNLHFIEFLLTVSRKVISIKVPPFDQISKRIRAKNISLIFQMNRNCKKKIFPEIQKQKQEFEIKKFKMPSMPKTYVERSNEYHGYINGKMFPNIYPDAEKFWNNDDIHYIFSNGILFKENESTKYTTCSNNISALIDTKNLNENINILFYYDENENKWQYYNKKKFSKRYVLIFNSDEKKSIDLVSNICNCSNFILDEKICVYEMNKKVMSSDISIDDIKEAFLILHVPTNKQNMPNIGRILFQIYSFLFAIIDIIIIILDEKNEFNQLSLLKDISSINKAYNFEKFEGRKHKRFSMNFHIFSERKDHYVNEDERRTYFNFKSNDFKSNLLSKFLNEFSKTESKYIFLFDSETSNIHEIKSIENKLKIMAQKQLSECIDLKKNVNFNVINISDPRTYKSFLDVLLKYIEKTECIRFKLKNGLIYIPLFEMSNSYIIYKNENNYFGYIMQKISDRKKMIKEAHNSEDDFQIIIDIQNEILSMFPLVDIDLSDKINSVLLPLLEQLAKKNGNIISSELQKSSEDNLQYLSKIIENEPYWTKIQISNIKNNHADFLKNEYFNIVKDIASLNIFIMIYNSNIQIVNDQINHDSKEIDNLFKKFLENLDKKKVEKVKLQEGTNYTIRERENEREIKVRVEIGGSLEDLIEQDFLQL